MTCCSCLDSTHMLLCNQINTVHCSHWIGPMIRPAHLVWGRCPLAWEQASNTSLVALVMPPTCSCGEEAVCRGCIGFAKRGSKCDHQHWRGPQDLRQVRWFIRNGVCLWLAGWLFIPIMSLRHICECMNLQTLTLPILSFSAVMLSTYHPPTFCRAMVILL